MEIPGLVEAPYRVWCWWQAGMVLAAITGQKCTVCNHQSGRKSLQLFAIPTLAVLGLIEGRPGHFLPHQRWLSAVMISLGREEARRNIPPENRMVHIMYVKGLHYGLEMHCVQRYTLQICNPIHLPYPSKVSPSP